MASNPAAAGSAQPEPEPKANRISEDHADDGRAEYASDAEYVYSDSDGHKGASQRQARARKKHKKINREHPEFELTYDMMLGIRTTVGAIESKPNRDLTDADFDASLKLRFPNEGSALTPAHQMREFKFKDYAPEAFRALRRHFGLKPSDYLLNVCGNFKLLEFIANGKSGQFFFYTHDRQFMIKTVTQAESKFLRKILRQYFHHVIKNPNTLLTHIYGMHRVKPHKKKEVHFLIFGSVFHRAKYIHTTFDLKGSSHGRSATEADKKVAQPVFKDNDFLERKQKIEIPAAKAKLLRAQVEKDVEFLRHLNIMDYSMLLGIHDSRRGFPASMRRKNPQLQQAQGQQDSKPNGRAAAGTADSDDGPESEDETEDEHTDTQTAPASVAGQVSPKRRAISLIVPQQQQQGNPPAAGPATAPQTGSPRDHADRPARVLTDPSAVASAAADPSIVAQAQSNDADAKQAAPTPRSGNKTPRMRSLSAQGDHERRQSNYGLPPSYNKFSKPEDIHFVAPEIDVSLPALAERDDRKFHGVHSAFTDNDGGLRSSNADGNPGPFIYYMGVIDILTTYNIKKRLEHFGKSITAGNTISAVNSSRYAKRFKDFLFNAIVEH